MSSAENVKRLIIINTWMWSVKGDPYYERFSRLMGGLFGRFLIKRFNFFVRVVMKKAIGDPSRLPTLIHRHYLKALEGPEERKGCWTFPKRIIDSSDWLDSPRSQRDNIKEKPLLILWGIKDIAFREDTGHFVQEEQGSELCPVVRNFMEQGV